MAQKRIVHLRVYRGKELNYDANGKVKNENHKVSLSYDTVEWRNYMNHLQRNGLCKVTVEDVLEVKSGDYVSTEDEKINEEVRLAFEGKKEVILTPEQKRIEELERMVKQLAEGNKPKKKKVETPEIYVPELPKGKTLDDLKRSELEDMFPNIQELNPANKTDFIEQVNEVYPNQYK